MLGTVGFVISYLPRVVATVMLVEDLLDPATSGSEKRALALDFLRKQGVPEKYVSVAGNLTDFVVSVLHAFGILQRSKKPEEAPTVQTGALSPMVAAVRRDREAAHEVAASDDAFEKFLDDTAR